MSYFSIYTLPSNNSKNRLIAPPFGLILSLLILLTAQFSYAGATYFTGSDNENNAGTGVADGDMDRLIGDKDPAAPLEFNIDVTGPLPTFSATLSIRAYDINNAANVYDYVYLNGYKLGKLAGGANQWSITSFKVPNNVIRAGNNKVNMLIDNWHTGAKSIIDWGQIVVDGGPGDKADITDVAITDYSIADGDVTIDAESTVEVSVAGNYVMEMNLIDPNGNNTSVLSQSFTASAGDKIIRQYSPSYPLSDVSGTYTIQALLFLDDAGVLKQQDIDTVTFEHTKNIGPNFSGPAATSVITANPNSIPADGASTSTITVQAKDLKGNNLVVGGANVLLKTTRGTLSKVIDHGDGTYDATLTSTTTAGAATVSATLNGIATNHPILVKFTGLVSTELSTINASPATIIADGTTTSTITVQLVDTAGNKLTSGGATVELSTDLGSLSGVTDNNDGTYSATLTSATTVGVATVSGKVDSVSLGHNTSVHFVAGEASAALSTITATPEAIPADGKTTSVITVQLVDDKGNKLTSGSHSVVLTTTLGTLSAVTDNQNGTYTAILTAPNSAGTATVSGKVDGVAMTDVAVVAFQTATVNGVGSSFTASPTTLVANGASTSTLTVQLLDKDGNKIAASGYSVIFSADKGSLSAVVDNQNGSYTAIYTSPASIESATEIATITSTINGSAGHTVTVNLTRPAAAAVSTGGNGQQNKMQTAVRHGGSLGAGLFAPLLGLLAARRSGRRRSLAALGGISLLLSISAHAGLCPKESGVHSYNSDCWYGGLGAGMSRLSPEENNSGWQVTDNKDPGFKLFAGYQFAPRWLLELDYSDMGKSTVKPDDTSLGGKQSISYKAPALWGIYQLPLGDGAWKLFAKAGVSAIQNSAGSSVPYEKTTSSQFALGAGVQRDVNDKWFVRAEIESLAKDAAYAGLAIGRYFGNSEPPAKPAPPAPVPVVAEVKPPKCPNTRPGAKVDADGCEIIEKFDKVRLNVKFKTASSLVEDNYIPEIEKIADYMQKHPDSAVVIEGHTDNVGKAAFNQTLSEKRAAAVREVLIKHFGIKDSRISSVGYGKTSPIASNTTEAGRAQNRRVMAVLPHE